MGKDNPSVLVLVETSGEGTIQTISLEALRVGRRIAEGQGAPLSAVIMGTDLGETAEELKFYGLDTIYTVDHPLLATYQAEAYLAAMVEVCATSAPGVILMGNTLTSLDLAPRVACKLEAGLVTDCVDVELADGVLSAVKPVYSGNVMAVLGFTAKPCMLTLRARAAEGAVRGSQPSGRVVPAALSLDADAMQVQVLERVLEEAEGVRLEVADRVVAGGRGMGGPEGFAELEAVAELLGAALGASRPPCDLEWVSSKAQVGQTGEIVAPSLYVAVGISGSTQHIAGMLGSKVIVAINKDPDANIFRVADFGVVGRFEEVLPAFREKLAELLQAGG